MKRSGGIIVTLSDRTNECVFCSVEPDLIILQNSLAFAMFDGIPVSQGHSLIIPRRHVADYSDLTANEILAIHQILAEVRPLIQERFSPDGFNIGVNIGFTGGQTIMHVHVHLIPRYKGDVSDPVGGVRNVIPGKGNYIRSSKWKQIHA